GLDGGEALIPAMEQIIKRGGHLGVKDIVIGMPHRGRLNILANVMQKPYRAIFSEFRGGSAHPEDIGGSGDVKYHLGASADREFDGNVVHLSMAANPSHLEAVNPVVLGKARAKQDKYGRDRKAVLPILLHGDAAFAGQGVVAECLGLSGLVGHRTGGTIHIIVNNQIGFTTAPHFSRSSPYPSDVAKMVEAPIFHVNGDDPEAVVHAAKVATEFRQLFGKDVVLDMFCYRRFGHNEGDEPSFTQPLMYKTIRKQTTTLEKYAQRLADEGLVPKEESDKAVSDFQDRLNGEFEAAPAYKPNKADWLEGRWKGLKVAEGDERRGETAVDADRLKALGLKLTEVPDDFNPHRTVKRLLESKRQMFETGEGIDWATAEALAFATLLDEGHPVRLSGQDSARGTFSQRHSRLIDQETEAHHVPLNHLREGQAHFEVIDSMLSEYAVLGFEYGYSWEDPEALTLWEAQFGDFANGAQVIVDQFMSSAEKKWLRMSGLVMLLPHGYEGQGPEHSSARLERYLQMCAEDNMQVANCTTPANYFHILRRQIHRSFRKPLILMTPKSLLRHKRCVSTLAELGPGSSFHRVLWDDAEYLKNSVKLKKDDKIRRVVICTGKVYYDLYEAREEKGVDDVYLMRCEQLYPVPRQSLRHELGRFKNAEVVWCQEEPFNMGAWRFIEPELEWVLGQLDGKAKRPRYVGRPAAAATATGLASMHKKQQEALVEEALAV
ncbi:MAG: 2-oxoglutarate dehydrogenase E1 component, partial [Alphaproteobacteria bacterium]|nr:2-oxoglutarate dehydrogenase E1 component [Alphaproteobacteria bacterium]MDX5368807.1 2-oxoglutarate dehydrogenase E1 component [Alphaproteobacteria bacterium]MDX5463535.1 2-oxoglutarate dehydrogenase E1 component [Alphaproteobacteria bacterium]